MRIGRVNVQGQLPVVDIPICNFFMIMGLLCFTIFMLVVTNKGVGQVISNRGYKEYRLGDYSNWLQNHLVNDKNWGRIKSCLMDTDICSRLGKEINDDAAAFYKKNLSPIQAFFFSSLMQFYSNISMFSLQFIRISLKLFGC